MDLGVVPFGSSAEPSNSASPTPGTRELPP